MGNGCLGKDYPCTVRNSLCCATSILCCWCCCVKSCGCLETYDQQTARNTRALKRQGQANANAAVMAPPAGHTVAQPATPPPAQIVYVYQDPNATMTMTMPPGPGQQPAPQQQQPVYYSTTPPPHQQQPTVYNH